MDIFTSDLDRTLIFSKRSYGTKVEEAICIEYFQGMPVSFISEFEMELLNKIQQQTHFVPVTSRSLAQYMRLTLPFVPAIAIAANGGIILRNGVVCESWSKQIEIQLQSILPVIQIPKRFQQQLQHFIRVDHVDQLFYVCSIDETNEHCMEAIDRLSEQLPIEGWDSYRNGLKFYILPHFMTKEQAVNFIKKTLSFDKHIAAGDSIMDWQMLQLADIAYIPQHGELAQLYPNYVLPYNGVKFAEKCLQQILK